MRCDIGYYDYPFDVEVHIKIHLTIQSLPKGNKTLLYWKISIG
jgi:hypothetical protein